MVCGHLPVRIVLPSLIAMTLGPGVKMDLQILLDAFLEYISETEQSTFRDALSFKTKFPLEVPVNYWMRYQDLDAAHLILLINY